jgi:outer membrane protein assembly factor BamE (lipoprotein component of BamABCDE complex)
LPHINEIVDEILPIQNLMKLSVVLATLCLAICSINTWAAPSIDGEYTGDTWGYLTVKKNGDDSYAISLTIGAGSCSGLSLAKGDVKIRPDNSFALPNNKKKNCQIKIAFDKQGAVITDSCGPDAPASPCAFQGSYTKR